MANIDVKAGALRVLILETASSDEMNIQYENLLRQISDATIIDVQLLYAAGVAGDRPFKMLVQWVP